MSLSWIFVLKKNASASPISSKCIIHAIFFNDSLYLIPPYRFIFHYAYSHILLSLSPGILFFEMPSLEIAILIQNITSPFSTMLIFLKKNKIIKHPENTVLYQKCKLVLEFYITQINLVFLEEPWIYQKNTKNESRSFTGLWHGNLFLNKIYITNYTYHHANHSDFIWYYEALSSCRLISDI